MGQEYEMLPEEVKAEFERHVQIHEQMKIQKQLTSFLQMIPEDGTGQPGDENMDVPVAGPPAMGGQEMAGNGSVPGPEEPIGGETIG